jgi:hypothetical protein
MADIDQLIARSQSILVLPQATLVRAVVASVTD